MATRMKAAVLVEPARIEVTDKPVPGVGPNDALARITLTTTCGTDVHDPEAAQLHARHPPRG